MGVSDNAHIVTAACPWRPLAPTTRPQCSPGHDVIPEELRLRRAGLRPDADAVYQDGRPQHAGSRQPVGGDPHRRTSTTARGVAVRCVRPPAACTLELLRRCDRQPRHGRNRNSSIDDEDGTMKTIRHFRNLTVAAISLMALSACAGMSQQDKSTAVGAGVGAVGGAVLTGGSAIGTVGGAAVGGIIGHEISKDRK